MRRLAPCQSCKPEQACLTHTIVLQIQTHLEGPIGIALYEWKDGQIGAASIQGGELLLAHRIPLPQIMLFRQHSLESLYRALLEQCMACHACFSGSDVQGQRARAAWMMPLALEEQAHQG